MEYAGQVTVIAQLPVPKPLREPEPETAHEASLLLDRQFPWLGNWVYLYRAVDSAGDTIDFMLSPSRDLVAAKHFLQLALHRTGNHGDQRGVCGVAQEVLKRRLAPPRPIPLHSQRDFVALSSSH